ncbi:MAG: hypothetical protein K5894_14515 [Lachnospiraceae bacterium]|nr:hypothetical protein [Lachnospiraceae bacterium]
MQTKGIIIGKIPHCVSHRIRPKNAVRINPSGEVELVNEETADKRMGKWGIAKPIHGVWAYVLYDRRFVVDVDNESYSLAPVYIFGDNMTPPRTEELNQAVEIVAYNMAILNVEGKKLPAIKVSYMGRN